jgi:putative FmdB family regulatory protein
MPIYEYKCRKCGHQFEALQKFSDEPLSVCPKCNANALQKCISASSFQLKGSGWYESDYKNKKNNAPDKKSESKPKDNE